MSAEILRRAADLMRERANSTSTVEHGAPWTFLPVESWDGDLSGVVRGSIGNHRWTVAESDYANDAEHIASWHPAVALAVADWLTDAAYAASNPDDGWIHPDALAVARAYLGEQS